MPITCDLLALSVKSVSKLASMVFFGMIGGCNSAKLAGKETQKQHTA